MQPYLIRRPSTTPAPHVWRRWVTGQWTKCRVVNRATKIYLGCVWKDKKGWRFALRGGRFKGIGGKYPSPLIYRLRDEAARAVWLRYQGVRK